MAYDITKYDIYNLDFETAVEEIEATEEIPKTNLDIVIEEILSSKDSYEDTGEYDEKLEASRRSNAMFIAYYCENGNTYDPSGKYLCKTCKARDLPDSCAWVSGKISMDTGSCMIYMIGKSSEQPLPVKLTQIQTQYTERPNVKAFGCSRCEYGKEAKEEDNAGRSLWCKFWGMHVMEPACCMKNEGEDDILAPGDKEIEATNHDDNLRKAEDIKMGLYAEQILNELEFGGPGSGRHKYAVGERVMRNPKDFPKDKAPMWQGKILKQTILKDNNGKSKLGYHVMSDNDSKNLSHPDIWERPNPQGKKYLEEELVPVK